jgi:capsular exopolysaccharide synthesis family protein
LVRQQSSQVTEPIPVEAETVLPSTEAEVDPIGRFVQFLKKRGWLIGVATAMGLIVGLATNHFQPRVYTAQANIKVAQDLSSQFRFEQATGGVTGEDDSEKLDTELEVLRSRSLAFETIKALNLEGNPDFVVLSAGQPWDLSNSAARQNLVSIFRAGLRVQRLGHTNIIQIFVTSKRPELASLMANTLIDRYIEHSFRENYEATAKISGWLDTQLNGLRNNLEKSQSRILELQKDIGINSIDQSHSIIIANLEELNKQYADAEVDRLLKESRLEQMKSSSPGVIDTTLGTMDPAFAASRQRLVELKSEYTSLTQTYGSSYPRVKSLKAQIDQLEHSLSQEETALVARAQKEFEAAQNNEGELRGAVDRQEQEAYGKGEKAMQYELVRRDYETNRLLYDGLQQRLMEAGIMAGLHSTGIHIVDSAEVPLNPSSPRTRFNQAAGAGIGFLIGLCLALVLEALDTNLKTMADIENALQLPLLAAIPQVSADELLPTRFREYATQPGSSSWSKMAEALRSMRTSILLSSPGVPPKVIMITSPRPEEGKSSLASLTAVAFALNGSRVLLIDSDLRRPSVHRQFRMGKGLGLSSVLSGKAVHQEAITEWSELPNLHVLPSGPVPPLPSELLGSTEMENLISDLRARYDFIVLDTPPVLTVTDASLLGRLSDATVIIIRYGRAPRQVVQRSIDLLDRSGAHLLGVVLNFVDFRSPEYSEYYGRKYYEYYKEQKTE